jgi:hypothetical protein
MDKKEYRRLYDEIATRWEAEKPGTTKEQLFYGETLSRQMANWRILRSFEINDLDWKYIYPNGKLGADYPDPSGASNPPTHTMFPSLSYSGFFELPVFEGLAEGI